MEGQSYYYNNKTKNICLINKDLLGLLFKNQKIKNASKILAKSYEDIVKSKDVPFEKINKNYYKWKVTNTDFIIITLDKSLDETLTFLKIPADNYKQNIKEVNSVTKNSKTITRPSEEFNFKTFKENKGDYIDDDDYENFIISNLGKTTTTKIAEKFFGLVYDLIKSGDGPVGIEYIGDPMDRYSEDFLHDWYNYPDGEKEGDVSKKDFIKAEIDLLKEKGITISNK